MDTWLGSCNVSRKWYVRMCTGLIWLTNSSIFLWTRWWAFVFRRDAKCLDYSEASISFKKKRACCSIQLGCLWKTTAFLKLFIFLLQLSAVVDGVYSKHSHTAGTFSMLSSSRVYVGGSQNTHALPGSRIHSNFVGCLRKVTYVTVLCVLYCHHHHSEHGQGLGLKTCSFEAQGVLLSLSLFWVVLSPLDRLPTFRRASPVVGVPP
jgi:hypothetical protein